MEATEVWNSWESRPPPVASVKQNCRVEGKYQVFPLNIFINH